MLVIIRRGDGTNVLSIKAEKVESAKMQFDMETKLNLIAKRATEDKNFKFTSLAYLLNETSHKECFCMLNKNIGTWNKRCYV